jgi:hypothetical protein
VKRAGEEIICDIEDGNIINDKCTSNDGGEISVSGKRWPDTGNNSYLRKSFVGGDSVSGKGKVEDVACNISSGIDYDMPQIGQEWMLTKFGDVYSELGYQVPLLNDEYFSTYWIGGNVSIPWNFGAGGDSKNNWVNKDYNDRNSNLEWFDYLYRLARRSDWGVTNGIDGVNNIKLNTSEDGIFFYNSTDTLEITEDCNGRKVIFVPKAEVEIRPDIEHKDRDSACLIVARNDVRLLEGNDATNSKNEDIVELAVITDSNFIAEEDGKYDKLRLRGFVFSGSTEFNRDLVLEKNIEDPAEIIVYDPRYLYLLKDMLGQRGFEEFECGRVKDVGDLCQDW